MNDKLFFDTNVLIYAVADDAIRTQPARDWLSRGGSISAQVLNEFANTARRKLRRSWDDVSEALERLRAFCNECVPVTEQTHLAAIELSRRHQFAFYDSLIIAAALEARCTILVTEDMQHGRLIDDRLTIHNPFSR